MKLSVSFLFFVAVFQFGTSNVLSKRDVQEELLLSDNNENGVQNENDVKMVKPGPLEVVLNNVNELIFGVCEQNCFGEFLVCFEGAIDGSFSTQLCDSKCGFYVNVNDQEEIAFMGIGARPKRNCTEMLMKNGITQQQGSNFMYPSCAPKIVNGIVKLNIMNATSDCVVSIENGIVKLNIMNATSDCVVSIKNAHIKVEKTTSPPTTATTLGKRNQTSSGKNAASTDESGSFFDDYWWIFLILGILIAIGIGIGVGVYCYLRRKKKAQKPVPIRRRRLQGSKSPIVLQTSTETQNGNNESAVRPNSLYQQSSILSRKSLLQSKKDEPKKETPEETDLTSMKPTA
uniref:Uncharacterized protein n=1 Tax=Panagrolaimus davidi TaxID=227884 RepID=A0A914Q8C9_9BILA